MAPIQPLRSSPFHRAQTLPQSTAPRARSQDGLMRTATGPVHSAAQKHLTAALHLPRIHLSSFTLGNRAKRLMGEARVAFVAQDFGKASGKVAMALQIEPDHYDAKVLRALINASTQHPEAAQQEFVALCAERPYEHDAHLARALSAFNQKDYAQAWLTLTHVTVRNPGDSTAWLFRAFTNQYLGHTDAAEKDLAHMRATLPENIANATVLSAREFCQGLAVDAWYRLAPAFETAHRPEVVSVLWAHIYGTLGYRQAAVDGYNDVLRRDPANIAAAALRAGALTTPG